MYRLYFIAKNNLKKKKSDALVLTGLIMLAVMMMYISLSVLLGGGRMFEEIHEKINGMDWHLVAQKDGTEQVDEILSAHEDVEQMEKSDLLYVPLVKYRVDGGKEKDYSFIFRNSDAEDEVNKLNTDFKGTLSDEQILLPYYMHVSDGCEIGDEIVLDISGETYVFELAGFSEDPFYSSPMMVSMYQVFISEETYEKISTPEAMSAYMWKVCLQEGCDTVSFNKEVLDEINRDVPAVAQSYFSWSYDWATTKSATMMMADVSMGIMLVFAMILLAVTLVIIRFSIANFCELNMKNIGMLRASGYTSRQLIGSFMMEMLLLTVLGGFIGIGLGTVSSDFVGEIISSLVGVSYQVGVDLFSAGCVFLFSIAVVLFITWNCSRPYGKIPVLDALREGIVTHNFRKNHIPLETTCQPLSLALGMKSVLCAKRKNLGILGIVTILSLSCCIGFGMYQNFAKDISYLMRLVGSEIGDAAYVGDDLDELGAEIEQLPVVEKVLYLKKSNVMISAGEKEENVSCFGWKNPEKVQNNFMLEGCLPEYDNEIVLSKMLCDKLGVTLGDIVYLEEIQGKKDFVVVGINQHIRDMGIGGMINYEGMSRLTGESKSQQMHIYGTGELTYTEMLDYLNEKFPEREAIDIVEMSKSITGIVALAMELMCGVFLVVTVIVVFLVVYLLIKAKVIRERKNYGLYKAIGFTTRQLCMQTIMSNLPVMVTGAVIGAVSSHWLAGKVALLGLSVCGIMKCEMPVAPHYMLITVAMITVVAFAVALGCSLRIRKIEPVKMLTQE